MLSREGIPELTKSELLLIESFEPAGMAAFLDELEPCDIFLKFAAILTRINSVFSAQLLVTCHRNFARFIRPQQPFSARTPNEDTTWRQVKVVPWRTRNSGVVSSNPTHVTIKPPHDIHFPRTTSEPCRSILLR